MQKRSIGKGMAWAAVALTTGLHGVSRAQTVSTTNTTGIGGADLPPFYSNLTVRHYTADSYEGVEKTGSKPHVQARLQLGTKLFQEKLDASFTLRMAKFTDDNKVARAYPYAEFFYQLLDSSYGSITPQVTYYPKYNKRGEFSEVGVDFSTPSLQLPTAVGQLSFMGTFFLETGYGAAYTRAKIRGDQQQLALAGYEATENVEAEDFNYTTYYIGNVGLDIAAVPGLSTYVNVEYSRAYTPQYVIDFTENDNTRMDGYEIVDTTETSWYVGYKLSDDVTVSNTLYHYTNGFYSSAYSSEARGGLPRVLNRAMVAIALR